MNLKECPCGETPQELCIAGAGQGGKWAYVYGDCCSTWEIEFRTGYALLDSEECLKIATSAWNNAPRKIIK